MKNKLPKVRTQEENEQYRKLMKKRNSMEWLMFTEQYIVRFWQQRDDGFSEKSEVSYFTAGKGRHDAVEKRFKKDYPSATIICVEYQ